MFHRLPVPAPYAWLFARRGESSQLAANPGVRAGAGLRRPAPRGRENYPSKRLPGERSRS
ncbi:hypothetical protein LG3211_3507 [Lysobacter gummosus]|nr:hypothetical protein LG3211_3507 [Lysobacter gummosus]